MNRPGTTAHAGLPVRSLVVSWALLVPLVAVATAWTSTLGLTGPGVGLLVFLVLATAWVAWATLSMAGLTRTTGGRIGSVVVAAAVSVTAFFGGAAYVAYFGHQVDAVVVGIAEGGLPVAADPTTWTDLGPISGTAGTAVGEHLTVVAAPGSAAEAVTVDRTGLGLTAGRLWVLGWLAGTGWLVVGMLAWRRRQRVASTRAGPYPAGPYPG